MRSLLTALALAAGAALAAPAGAQDAPPRETVTVPLPAGSGVFYYRSGTPGGVRIRSRSGRDSTVIAPSPTAAVPAPAPVAPPAPIVIERDRQRRPEPRDGVSRLDLLLLERSLLDAIDRRERSGVPVTPSQPLVLPPFRPQAPQVLPPAAPPAVAPPAAPPTPVDPVPAQPTPVDPAPARPGAPATAQEIERSILELGLFRTTAVNFEFAKAGLLPTSAATLSVLADVLRRYPQLRIEVGGHTDNRGSDAINDPLSQRRAESVVEYLVSQGVGRSRLSAVGYGERRPVADNGTETGRALNRRVEFTVLNPEDARQETVREVPASEADALRRMIREEIERARDDS